MLLRGIDPQRVIGCIAYPAASVAEPGVIKHIEGNRFPVGELDGRDSERVRMISGLFEEAGFKARVLDDIRSEIWLKLWGNLTFNPISALTHSTLVDICQFPLTRGLAATMMTEAQQVAERLGAHFRVSMERRIAGAESVGKHKTSMLQDVEAGKPLEVDGMLGVVVELAEMTGVEVPGPARAPCLRQPVEPDDSGRGRAHQGGAAVAVRTQQPVARVPAAFERRLHPA